MKKLVLVITLIVTALLFIKCADENPIEPIEKNELNSLAKAKTNFTGNSTFYDLHPDDNPTAKPLPNGKVLLDGRVSIYYDDVSDPRVKGFSTWYINKAHMETDGSIHFTGKAELLVDDNGGKWEMSWHGNVAADGSIIDYVTGKGIEGAVKGLVAKWIYTRPVGMPGYYDVEGYIFEKK